MIWQAPWLWAGLLTVALPVLIHLLGRGTARRLPFPTLRFFGATRPLPTRSTRLHDLLLLAVRIAILTAAVAALAQPLLLTARRKGELNAPLARAVIVDTSASMQRTTTAGERAVVVATRTGQLVADSAATAIVLSSAAPAHAIAGALQWIARQAGRGELVIVSDFQAGTVDANDIAAVPHNIGVRLIPLALPANSVPVALRTDEGHGTVTAHVVLAPGRTDVEWTRDPAAPGEAPIAVTLLAGNADLAATGATRTAAATVPVRLPVAAHRPIVIVYADFADRAGLLQRVTPLRAPWMADLVARVGADATLRAAADGDSLILFTGAAPGSLASAELLARLRGALSMAPPLAELDPLVIPDSALAAWQRPPAARVTPAAGSDRSDGRWFWVAALLLLAMEWLLRRQMTAGSAAEVAHDAAG